MAKQKGFNLYFTVEDHKIISAEIGEPIGFYAEELDLNNNKVKKELQFYIMKTNWLSGTYGDGNKVFTYRYREYGDKTKVQLEITTGDYKETLYEEDILDF